MTKQEKILPFVDDSSGAPVAWVCRVVEQFDSYGRGFELTNSKEEPLIEFYDARYPFTEFGQFVSRYHLDDLAKRDTDSRGADTGLLLDTQIPSWRISGANLSQCLHWVQSAVLRPAEHDLVRAACDIDSNVKGVVSRGTVGTVVSQNDLGLTVEFDLGGNNPVIVDVTRFAVTRFVEKDKPKPKTMPRF